jgi:hypothetical protein
MRSTRRGLASVLTFLGATAIAIACAEPHVPSSYSSERPDAVTVDNATGASVTVVYEAPDLRIEKVIDLGPGESAVLEDLFTGREGLCRTGRLVALAAGSNEIDELFNVCKGRIWTVEASSGGAG